MIAMEFPVTRSWWETLSRPDLEREAEARSATWKTKPSHFSMAIGMERLRETWEPRGVRPTRVFTPEQSTDE